MVKGIDYRVPQSYDGLSDLDYHVAEGQGIYMENVDGKTQPQYLKLARKPVSTFLSGLNALPRGKLDDFFFTSISVYYKDNVRVALSITVSSYPILNLSKFNLTSGGESYLWIYRNTATGYGVIGKIDVASAGTTASSWSPSLTYYTTLDAADQYPMYNRKNTRLYIGHGKKVGYLENSGVFVDAIEFESEVMAISKNGHFFAVYLKNGQKKFWDGSSSNNESDEQLHDDNVRFVNTDLDGFDRVVMGGDYKHSLMALSAEGYRDPDPLAVEKSPLLGVLKFGFDISLPTGQNMARYMKNLYVPVNEDGRFVIYSYGKEHRGFQPSYSIPFALNVNGRNFDEIGFLASDETSLYIGYKDNFIPDYLVDKIDLDPTISPSYQPLGKWYTKIIDMGDESVVKEITEMNVWLTLPAITTSAKIYASVDDQAWEEIYTGTYSALRPPRVNLPLNLRFRKIVFYIELASTDPSVTPKFAKFSFKFNFVQT